MPTAPKPDPDASAAPGLYRIHVVAELTGVPSATLRAWERRFGVPVPSRTSSGYRLYSERDVEVIREMQRLLGAGVSASEAARTALAALGEAPQPAGLPLDVDVHEAAGERIVEAVTRFDAGDLDAEIRRSLLLGSAPQVVQRTLTHALRRIGDLWLEGHLSIAQEHLASERIGKAVRDLVGLATREDAEDTIVLACFAEEDHVIGVLTTALSFALWGYRPIVLGARTPPEAIRDAVLALSPSLVALSVMVPPPAARLRELLDGYAEAVGDRPWLVGGGAASKIATDVESRGGTVAASDPARLRTLTQSLLRAGKRAPSGDAHPRKKRKS